jgi:pyruvate formate lyase activating enzyme
MSDAFVRESLLQERVGNKVRCNVCARRCVIPIGGHGWCRTRENRAGTLVTLIYGDVSSQAANPIEKKPLFHFCPGSWCYTVGSWSCNFGCPWCQNWDISKAASDGGEFISPQCMIELTERSGCDGTSISFNEPTLSLEWSLEVFRLSRARNLYNTFVTNGYMTPEALDMLIDAGLDALNVDVKGDAIGVRKYGKGIDVNHVWASCRLARSRGVHVEITTLVVPTVNDAPDVLHDIAARIVDDLGPEVPWHVSGYYPAYQFTVPPTPPRTLERAWHIGREAGLEFVYVGNVPGHRYDDTYCPQCSTLLIERRGFEVISNHVQRGRCPWCQRSIAGVWQS